MIPIAVVMLLGSGPALATSNACKADLTGDLVVNFADLAVLKSVFFQRCNDPGPTCGDGVAQGPTEPCDDGNLLDGDGCSETCTIEVPPPPGPSYVLPATGQTTCWNDSGRIIPCAGTGQDGEIQTGAALAYVDNGDGTITDSNTGLMWEKLSDDGTIHDWNNKYTWANAVAVKIAGLNAASGFAGHTDWRLPNLNELKSIRNLEYFHPAVSPAFNAACTLGCSVTSRSCTTGTFFSSSSANVFGAPITAWTVNSYDGYVYYDTKNSPNYVRAVRGGS